MAARELPSQQLPPTAPQFDTLEQQNRTATFGMWIFLMTEVMMFGALFTTYTAYRILYPDAWAEGSRHLNLLLGAINTAVLLVSSVTMVLAEHAARVGDRRALVRFLAATAIIGAVFLAIKGLEYYQHYQDNLVPGFNFAYPGPRAHEVALFFLFYFAMTGLHTVHLTIGVGIVTVMLILARRGWFTPEHHTPVELTGLFWHFVDIIWIFLLPLLYLFGLT